MHFTNSDQISLFLEKSQNRHSGRFSLRLLGLHDLPELLHMRNEILAQLPNPDLHMREPDEIDYLRAHLAPLGEPGAVKNGKPLERGEIIGTFDSNGLVAYGMLGLPFADAEDNLGRFLPIAPAEHGKVAHIAGCMVREQVRGQGLHRMLVSARMALAQMHDRPVCAARVSLYNHASRRNMQKKGMRIAWVGDILGLKRQILGIDLRQPWALDDSHALLVASDDFQRQCQLSQQGWWGAGEIDHSGGGHTLVFQKYLAGPHQAQC